MMRDIVCLDGVMTGMFSNMEGGKNLERKDEKISGMKISAPSRLYFGKCTISIPISHLPNGVVQK
eukprot:14476460-Ditylum_brightwellii.AAC.1